MPLKGLARDDVLLGSRFMKVVDASNFARCILMFAIASVWCHAQPNADSEDLKELRKLPEIALDRKSEFDVAYQALPGGGADIRRYGFAFKTPSLVDGPATWLVVWDHEQPDPASWVVTHASGAILEIVAPTLADFGDYPELAAKYPAGKSVQLLRVANRQLVKASRYQAVLTTRGASPPLGISMNVAASGVGVQPGEEVREMEIPEGSVDAMRVIELVENIRMFQGDAAAIEFLEAQFALKVGRNGGFRSLFIKVWNEAQFGTGIDDPVWSSRLNDAAFTSAYRIGNYAAAFEIMNNLCASLGKAARFGRLAEVHAMLEDAYEKGGLNMDPTSHPDLGAAIPTLPVIRHRNITMARPYSQQHPSGPVPISQAPSFNELQASALTGYAFHRMNRGDWHGAMEWSVWLRDWASDDEGVPLQARNGVWYSATSNLAYHLESLGFTEDALAIIEEAVAAPYGMSYRGRAKINAAHQHLMLQRLVGRPDPEMVPKLRELITQMENHVHLGRSAAWSAIITLADALFDQGQFDEGDRLIEEIIQEGSHSARWTRLDRWLATGKVEGVEAELIALLSQMREGGRKVSELGLYSRYADFLESTGRLQEALTMRQEAVRLARDFNGFTKLPEELAKLAALLNELGDANLAAKAADEARALLKAGNLPALTIENVAISLATIVTTAPARAQDADESQPDIDLQPHRGLVIPLEGASWTGYLTLANPGIAAVQGTLEISGAPHMTHEEEGTGDVLVGLSQSAGHDERSTVPLHLDPGSYRLITVAADAAHADDGEMKFVWRSANGGKVAQASMLIDKREEGVAGAVIQAGDYQANPFYGVPIYLGYVANDQRPKSSPIRFVASQTARIEIHLLDGTPLAVDRTGNGSLLDSGDEVFGETDGAGNLQIPLTGGVAALRIIAYAQDRIEADGLKIDIEVLDDGEWTLHSRNRIE